MKSSMKWIKVKSQLPQEQIIKKLINIQISVKHYDQQKVLAKQFSFKTKSDPDVPCKIPKKLVLGRL